MKLSIGICNQHILHGALQTAVQTAIWNLDKFMKAMYCLFHESPEGAGISFPLRWVLPANLG